MRHHCADEVEHHPNAGSHPQRGDPQSDDQAHGTGHLEPGEQWPPRRRDTDGGEGLGDLRVLGQLARC